MKSSLFLVLILCGMCAFTASASAGDELRDENHSEFKKENQSLSLKDLISKIKKHHDKDNKKDDDRIPIDPGKGDGKPVGRPGFVWVGDHWERERASTTQPKVIVDSDTIVVRDHRKPIPGTGGSTSSGGVVTGSPIIRDRRNDSSNAHGGVTVTSSGKPRPKGNGGGGILGTVGGAVSGAVDSVGDAVGAAGHAVGGAASSVGHAVGGAASTVGHGASTVVKSAGSAVGLGGKSDSTPSAKMTIIRDHR
jgi:hypothetical protein